MAHRGIPVERCWGGKPVALVYLWTWWMLFTLDGILADRWLAARL